MTNIVVDTNIIFSALLNIDSKIGQILISGKNYFNFYAPAYIKFEILEHKEKIKSIGNFTDDEFIEIFELILKNITILNHSIIPVKIYKNAELLCKDIDLDDTVFVAVTNFKNGTLWTGDLKLINGLMKKGFKNTIKTNDLYQTFLNTE